MSDNEKFKRLFEFCVKGDRIGLADYIITNGCNPSAYDAHDSLGKTALHIACQHGHLLTVRSLIEVFGCYRFIRDNAGNLPVHYACLHGHLPIVDYLLHFKGVNITNAVLRLTLKATTCSTKLVSLDQHLLSGIYKQYSATTQRIMFLES